MSRLMAEILKTYQSEDFFSFNTIRLNIQGMLVRVCNCLMKYFRNYLKNEVTKMIEDTGIILLQAV